MSTPIRAATFVLALAVVFAAALGIGRLAGPLDTAVASHESDHADEGEHRADHGADHAADGSATQAASASVAGLQTSEGGYTLELADDRVGAGRRPIRFTITGPDGAPLTAYDEQHERDLHLIVVRRDLTGFQHVHPTLDADTGTWSVDGLDCSPAPGGSSPTSARPAPKPRCSAPTCSSPASSTRRHPARTCGSRRSATTRSCSNGDLTTGESKLTLQVSKDGNPVTDLQPYLGAYGHLVAMRAGDLGYLHVHPDGEPGETPAGPDIVFHTEFPSDGSYRLFLDFRHQGVVRTAAFTVTVGGAGSSGVGSGEAGDSGEHGEEGDHDH